MSRLHRRGDPVVGDALQVATLARQALEDRGIASRIEGADDVDGVRLVGPDGFVWILANLVGTVRRFPRHEWPGLVAGHVAGLLETRDAVPAEQLAEGELRARLRTRLIADVGLAVDLSYGRRFAPGVVEMLCVDHPQTVATLGVNVLAKLSLSLDELFEQGRKNTDAEPIDERLQVDGDVWALAGDSLFIASRVAVDGESTILVTPSKTFGKCVSRQGVSNPRSTTG